MIKEKGGVNAAVFIEFLKRVMTGVKKPIFLIVTAIQMNLFGNILRPTKLAAWRSPTRMISRPKSAHQCAPNIEVPRPVILAAYEAIRRSQPGSCEKALLREAILVKLESSA